MAHALRSERPIARLALGRLVTSAGAGLLGVALLVGPAQEARAEGEAHHAIEPAALEQEGHGAGDHTESTGRAPHAASAHGHHDPGDISQFNWWWGLLGEAEVEEPSLLYRPKGMQPPFAALLLNTAILLLVLGYFGRRPLAQALRQRKESIMRGIDEAAQMKAEAQAQLGKYEDKLKHIDDEIRRVKREMKEAGELERQRILAEAKHKRERMEREARQMVELELNAAREELRIMAIRLAMQRAEERLSRQLSLADHQRVFEQYLDQIEDLDLGERV